jgi:exosortase
LETPTFALVLMVRPRSQTLGNIPSEQGVARDFSRYDDVDRKVPRLERTTVPTAALLDKSEQIQRDSVTWATRVSFAIIAGLIAAIFASPLANLVKDWWTDTEGASYGILVPPLALYIAWAHRRRTFSVAPRQDPRGLLAIFFSCTMFLAGKFGAEYFLTRLSLILVLAGLSWTFWGWPRTRTLAFPFLLLVTMIPLPMLVYNRITLPLQLLSSQAATALIQAFGGVVYRDGNVLHLPYTTLGVTEACSGLHSLASLVVGSLLLGFIECSRLQSRALLVLLAIPFAIAVNVVRVAGTAFLADINPAYADGFYHAFSGWLVFLAGFGFFWGLAKGLHVVLDRGART